MISGFQQIFGDSMAAFVRENITVSFPLLQIVQIEKYYADIIRDTKERGKKNKEDMQRIETRLRKRQVDVAKFGSDHLVEMNHAIFNKKV